MIKETAELLKVLKWARKWARRHGVDSDDAAQCASVLALGFVEKNGWPEEKDAWKHFWVTVKQGTKKWAYEDTLVRVPWSSNAARVARDCREGEPREWEARACEDNFIIFWLDVREQVADIEGAWELLEQLAAGVKKKDLIIGDLSVWETRKLLFNVQKRLRTYVKRIE
jgi:hypothetical protein